MIAMTFRLFDSPTGIRALYGILRTIVSHRVV